MLSPVSHRLDGNLVEVETCGRDISDRWSLLLTVQFVGCGSPRYNILVPCGFFLCVVSK